MPTQPPTSRERSTTIDPRFIQTSDRARVTRGLIFGVSWTFGKPLNEEKNNDLVSEPGPP